LQEHLAKILGGYLFSNYFTGKSISVSSSYTKQIAQIVKKLLRLDFNPSRKLEYLAGAINGEIRQIRKRQLSWQRHRAFVVPAHTMMIKLLGDKDLKM